MGIISDVLDRLERVKRSGYGWTARCPSHEDRRNSLSIAEGMEGRVLLHCHAGCEYEDITAALGIQVADLFPDRNGNGRPEIVATYNYTDENGALLFQVVRLWPKGFRQRRPDGNGGWEWSVKGVRRVPYRLPELRRAVADGRCVIVVEGEKDANRLAGLGFAATTNAAGAGKWTVELAEHFCDARVLIVPDNDGPGRAHAEDVASKLSDVAKEIRILKLPNLPEKGDISDWLDRGGNAEKLKQLASVAPRWAPGSVKGALAASTDAPTVSLADLLADSELARGVQWDLRPLTAHGVISLHTAAPKAGKSTWAGHYAHAKATGGTFMGQKLEQGIVLLVSPDEPLVAVVRRHFSLGTPGDALHIWDLRRDPTPTIRKIARRAAELGAALVIVDTLGRVARVRDENDNAAWIRWFAEVDPFIRTSAAAWLFLHHDRKSGGKDGGGVRGASAIFGCVDVAFSLHRDPDDRRRRILRVEGSRLEEAEDVVLTLAQDGSYQLVGKFRAIRVLEDEELSRVRAVLADEPATVQEIAGRLTAAGENVPETSLRHRLEKLVSSGLARRLGRGGRSDPYRFGSLQPSDPRESEHWSEGPSNTHPTTGVSGESPQRTDPLDDTTSTANGGSGDPNLHSGAERLEDVDVLDANLHRSTSLGSRGMEVEGVPDPTKIPDLAADLDRTLDGGGP